MTLGGLCFDGANPSGVTAVTCNGAASQNWYWLWGQIRNVENGLCLDAPSSSSSDSRARAITLTPCGVHPPVRTQLWIKSADHILINSASGNCIHQQGSAVQVGTGICANGRDILTGPKNVVGINGFIADIGRAQCTTPRVRKDIRDLSDAERKVFFDALNTLNRIPSLMGRRNRYQDYVASHGAGGRWFHGTPYFLPWHRYYAAVLEQDIQKITGNSSFAIPYWAWGSDATTWQRASTGVLTADRFGTTGARNANECVRDGFMNGEWVPTDADCLMRGYNDRVESDSSVATYTEDFILLTLQTNPQTRQRYTDYDSFRSVIESLPHNNFHMVIAGDSSASQMGNPAASVNDPIFFMHHNNIDRHWHYFQNANPTLSGAFNGRMQYPPGSGNTINVALSDILVSFNVPVSAGMGVRSGALCHSYQPYSKSISSVSVQFSRLARRSSEGGLHRRTFSSGQELVADLDPIVAGKVIQNDMSLKTDLVPISTVEDRKDLPVPPRAEPAALTDAFLDRMSEVMDVDREEIRRLEKAAFEMMRELREKTDEVLMVEFGKDVGSASFDQHAVAVKVAVAIMEIYPEDASQAVRRRSSLHTGQGYVVILLKRPSLSSPPDKVGRLGVSHTSDRLQPARIFEILPPAYV
ncbi:hypothetical protein HDU67_008092 [Dinochytrium kinnereticum]|nr:hypothetical protein HDU67_008092 [Dinochytrium kinnereticum]